MTANSAGAPSRAALLWEQANWLLIEAEVKRLQVRIAKAVRESKWGKVKALQRMLARSHSGKMLAVKRVTEKKALRQTVRCHPMVLKDGLSRMRGDSHVRFLGGGGAAMRRCYPTRCITWMRQQVRS